MQKYRLTFQPTISQMKDSSLTKLPKFVDAEFDGVSYVVLFEDGTTLNVPKDVFETSYVVTKSLA